MSTAVTDQGATFWITDINFYVLVITLSTQENAKLLQHLKSGSKITITWNKYQSNVATQSQNSDLDYLTDPSFQGVNRNFVLSFEDNVHRASYKRYFSICRNKRLQSYEWCIKLFDEPVKNNWRTYVNIQKITTGQWDDYTTGCLLDNVNFKNYYKMVAIDLSKQEALEANPEGIQQINFTGNLENNATILFIIEETKGTILNFSQRTVKLL